MDFIELEITLLLALSNVLVGLGIAFHFLRNRIKSAAFQGAGEFFDQLVEEIKQKPEVMLSVMRPAIKVFMQEAGYGKQTGGGGGFKLTGNKFVDNLIMGMGEKMLTKGLGKAEEAASSPFG